MKLRELEIDAILIFTVGMLFMLMGITFGIYKFLDISNIVIGGVLISVGIVFLSMGYDMCKEEKE